MMLTSGRRGRESAIGLLCVACLLTFIAGCDAQEPKDEAPTKEAASPAAKPRVEKTPNGISLVYLPGAEFLMGRKGVPTHEPVHPVNLSPFWIGQYEVTNIQFEQFKKRRRPVESKGDNQPVTRVTYDQAVAFCKWLSKKEKARYRLPTEAEWEYAARGGLVQKEYPWGDDRDWQGKAAIATADTMPVGSYAPNGFGLYDVSGNVWEWVSDWYDGNYYRVSPRQDPKGPVTYPIAGWESRISRGNSFGALQGEVWMRAEMPIAPELIPDLSKFGDPFQQDGSGFRIVREVDEKDKGESSEKGN